MRRSLILVLAAPVLVALLLAGCELPGPNDDPARHDAAAMNTALSLMVTLEQCHANRRAGSTPADGREVTGYQGCERELPFEERRDAAADDAVQRIAVSTSTTGWELRISSHAGTDYLVARTGDEIELTCEGEGERCIAGVWEPADPSPAITAILAGDPVVAEAPGEGDGSDGDPADEPDEG